MPRPNCLVFRLAISLAALSSVITPMYAADAAAEAEAKARLLNDVKYLASDELEGRGLGLKGLDLAAEFVRQQFAAVGLKTDSVQGQPFQTFNLVAGAELGQQNSLKLSLPNGETITVATNSEFEVCSFGGSGQFAGEVVFCGYGIDDPESKYNDFAPVDVKNKIVIIMRRNPGQSDPHGPFASAHGISKHAELRTKMSQAVQHGAAAVLFVNDPHSVKEKAASRNEELTKALTEVATLTDAYLAMTDVAEDKLAEAREKLSKAVTAWKTLREAQSTAQDDELMRFGYAGSGDGKSKVPAVHITQAVCNRLLSAAMGKTLAELEAEIDSDLRPKSAVLSGCQASGVVTIERREVKVSNVIGVIEGSGPHADEVIVIGAHYDHVGRGGENSLAPGSKEVHNGADDNASGTVALIELARRLAQRSQPLPRKLVFIAFTGEELGLLGSARYVKEPVFPLDKTIAMFNMDMVGRLQDDKLTIFGSGTSPRWEPELNALNQQAGFKLSYKPEGFGPSDHSSFYGKKIPVLHFFTGNHPDYHRPSDDWEKLNLEGMLRVVDMLEQMVIQTAENPERPAYVEVAQPAMAQRGGNRPYFGTIPDFGSEGEGYAISGAAPGSPADKGGLKAGDHIIRLGENKITNLDDFDLALRKFKAGEEIEVVVLRDGKETSLKVTLAPPR